MVFENVDLPPFPHLHPHHFSQQLFDEPLLICFSCRNVNRLTFFELAESRLNGLRIAQ